MKKSIIALILITVLGVCSVGSAQGNVEAILEGNQDYILLATVVDFDDSSIIVAPYHVIRGEEDSAELPPLNSNIAIEKFRYSYCADHSDVITTPKAGDNIFISINANGGQYTMAHGAYKISSVDYKLLTFYASESMKNSECLADIVALAYFVRTDGSMREFKFENGTLTAYRDDKPLTLYPSDNLSDTVTFLNIQGKVTESVKTKDVIIDGEEGIENRADYRWLISYGVILLGMIVGGIVVYNTASRDILNKKKSKKEAK